MYVVLLWFKKVESVYLYSVHVDDNISYPIRHPSRKIKICLCVFRFYTISENVGLRCGFTPFTTRQLTTAKRVYNLDEIIHSCEGVLFLARLVVLVAVRQRRQSKKFAFWSQPNKYKFNVTYVMMSGLCVCVCVCAVYMLYATVHTPLFFISKTFHMLLVFPFCLMISSRSFFASLGIYSAREKRRNK